MSRQTTAIQRVALGCLGAITPMILNLYFVDFEASLRDATLWAVLGYAAKVVALLWVGGIVAALHKEEHVPFKIFELGMLAPALIIASMNGNHIEDMGGGASPLSLGLSTVVHAQNRSQVAAELKTFSVPEETPFQGFLRGFGLRRRLSDRSWFVITGSNLDVEKAEKQADRINEKGQFQAQVFAPRGEYPFYSVVIGANLTPREAVVTQRRAIAAGLSDEVLIWSVRGSQPPVRTTGSDVRVEGKYEVSASTLRESQNATVVASAEDEKNGKFEFQFVITRLAEAGQYRVKLEKTKVYEDASLGSTRWLFKVRVNDNGFVLPQRRYDDEEGGVYRPLPDYRGENVEAIVDVPTGGSLRVRVLGFKPKDIVSASDH